MTEIDQSVIDEIEKNIILKIKEFISPSLLSLKRGGRFSSSELGKEIGKLINKEVEEIRKSRSGKKHTALKKEEKPVIKKSKWTLFMNYQYKKVKAKNLETGVKMTDEEIIKIITDLWTKEKDVWEPPN